MRPSRGERGWRLLYQLAVHIAAPLYSAGLLWRGFSDRSQWQGLGQRFGLGERQRTDGIWVHTVSVGEVQAAAVLVRALHRRHPQLPLTVTTFTATGQARARALFEGQAQVRYLPFDLPGSVRRFLDRLHPRIAVIFETELWPNLYRECGRRDIPLLLASARLSPRSTARYVRFKGLFRPMLADGVEVAAQTQADAQRFQQLGADPDRTHVTGNLKFDMAVPPGTRERGRALRELYAPGRAVWVAGSTHAGEEEAVLAAHREVLKAVPGTLLILVPRHPPRFAGVAELIEREGFRLARRSLAGSPPPEGAQVLLVDTLGELLDFYACADVAFVGGSLVPIGGHNLLEPAALGCPILTGPSYTNAPEIARLLIARGAAEVAPDAQGLSARVAALLADPEACRDSGEKGRACVEENRGALERVLTLIDTSLERTRGK